jgi:luciferase-type oxidoreductase
MSEQGHTNAGYRRLFDSDGLSVGVGFPLTGVRESTPAVDDELRLAEHAEAVGFDVIWVRDVSTYWPRFGDAGGAFDPWPLLSQLAAHTDDVALGTSSVVLPLRHPIHVAKAAATVDRFSGGRLVLGVASGDRDVEFSAFDIDQDDRSAAVRERIEAIRTLWREEYPIIKGPWGQLNGEVDVLPKPTTEALPILPTGYTRQSTEWIAGHGDGWLFYHLPESTLRSYLDEWRDLAGAKPFAMVMRVALADDPEADAEPVHQGFCAGIEWFKEYFDRLRDAGVDHVLVALDSDEPTQAMTTFATEIIDDL